jgi:hypothetical protein
MTPPVIAGGRKFRFREITVALVYYARSKDAQVNLSGLLIAEEFDQQARETWKRFCARAFKRGRIWKIFGIPKQLRLDHIDPKEFSEIISSFFMRVREATKATSGGPTSKDVLSVDTPRIPPKDTMSTT